MILAAALLSSGHLFAQDKDDAATIAAAARIEAAASEKGGDAAVSASISDRFSQFAGSSANAMALVTGLRSGSSITLTQTVNGVITATAFTPATGKQGYGNVFISLALAQQSLVKAGIASPTPAQLQTALNGGTVTTSSGRSVQLSGVLKLRASGEGWGQVAKSMDVKLGRAMSDLRKTDDTVEKITKPERVEKVDKVENKVERSVDRPVKPDLPVHPGR